MTIQISGTTGISGIDGSAGTPALQGSDTNTGISFSSDVIIASTGGAERFRVDSQGRLGVGTASPSSLLDVSNGGTALSASGGTLARLIGSAVSRLDIVAGNSSYSILEFSRANLTAASQITYEHSSNSLHFTTNGATERARIDSSGRLLVGTSSTSEGSRAVFQGWSGDANGPGIIRLAAGTTSPADGAGLGTLNFTDSNHATSAQVGAFRDGGTWNTSTSRPTRLVFSTTANGASSPTERMRIGADGSIELLGPTTSINWGLAGNKKWSISPNNNDFYIANNDFSKYAVLVTQNFTGWTFGSDRRIKENIADLDYGIDQLKQIKARRFNFIGENAPSIGFIAQELQEVVPEAVTGAEIPFAEDDTPQERAGKTMGIAKDALIPVLVKALQEAVVKIETLEAKVAALEAS